MVWCVVFVCDVVLCYDVLCGGSVVYCGALRCVTLCVCVLWCVVSCRVASQYGVL